MDHWMCMKDFMFVAGSTRVLPSLVQVGVIVHGWQMQADLLCSDWEYALFDSGRRACSDALWRSWAKCVLGRRRTLEMTVYTTDRRGTDFFYLLERTVEASLSFLGRERFLATVSPRMEIM